MIFAAPPDREARLESRELPQATPKRFAAAAPKPAAGVEGIFSRLQSSLDRVEARQTTALNAMEERYDTKAKRIRSVLADLGMDGKKRTIHFWIGEDTGMIGMTYGVEWCVVGLDRNWAYNPSCKMALP